MIKPRPARWLFLWLVLMASYGMWGMLRFMTVPVSQDGTLRVASGWGLTRMGQELVNAGFLSHEAHGHFPKHWFVLLGRLQGIEGVQEGEYAIHPGDTAQTILARVHRGDVIRHRLTIPEGWNLQNIANALSLLGWSQLDLLTDATAFKKWQLPTASLEGWLFPETYFYRRGDTLSDLLGRMIHHTQSVLQTEWAQRPSNHPLTAYETLILASIIEKETGQPEERTHISAVFHNRLRQGMLLQTDPTVIYGIAHFDGNLTREHLRTPSPYNTYLNPGLPPTPICNPGRAAIHAAFHPMETRDLYFVAKGDGSHVFSANYGDHQRQVERYQSRSGSRKQARVQ